MASMTAFLIDLVTSLGMVGIIFILLMVPVVIYLALLYSPWEFHLEFPG